ncbi:hypothetical protein KIPB_012508, partial [Kipferlia bialata]
RGTVTVDAEGTAAFSLSGSSASFNLQQTGDTYPVSMTVEDEAFVISRGTSTILRATTGDNPSFGNIYVDSVLEAETIVTGSLQATTLDIGNLLLSAEDVDNSFALRADSGYSAYFALLDTASEEGFEMSTAFSDSVPTFSIQYTDGVTKTPVLTAEGSSSYMAIGIPGAVTTGGSTLTLGSSTDADFYVQRTSASSVGSDTYFVGQSAPYTGGDVIIKGGYSTASGGGVSILGGSSLGTSGSVSIGTESTTDVTLGSAATPVSVAGTLSVTGTALLGGSILMGSSIADDLLIGRVTAGEYSGSTTISGQDAAGSAGDLILEGGVGALSNGDVHIGRTSGNVLIGYSTKTTVVYGSLSVTKAFRVGDDVDPDISLNVGKADSSLFRGVLIEHGYDGTSDAGGQLRILVRLHIVS